MVSKKLDSGSSFNNWKAQLKKGALLFNIPLPDESVQLFENYLHELLAWNVRINITAIKTPDEVVIKHFLDSLSIIPDLPEQGCVADVGSGGGFPGIPLKIARPALQVTLIEATRKKANFLRHIIRSLDLAAIEVWEGRVEHFPAEKKFDCIISRAFTDIKNFLELAAPLVKKGGIVVAMKGRTAAHELRAAEAVLAKIGMQIHSTRSFLLPANGGARTIIVFKKCFT